jgi:methylated-DNA-[protein]-cysteine S-methyltransferase
VKTSYSFRSPIGTIIIEEDDQALVRCQLSPHYEPDQPRRPPTALLYETASQLTAYFHGYRKSFDLPFRLSGTGFQQALWAEIAKIPYGQTMTYGELARRVGRPESARHVALALARNAMRFVLPTHRVVRDDGKIGGGPEDRLTKLYLLCLEETFLGLPPDADPAFPKRLANLQELASSILVLRDSSDPAAGPSADETPLRLLQDLIGGKPRPPKASIPAFPGGPPDGSGTCQVVAAKVRDDEREDGEGDEPLSEEMLASLREAMLNGQFRVFARSLDDEDSEDDITEIDPDIARGLMSNPDFVDGLMSAIRQHLATKEEVAVPLDGLLPLDDPRGLLAPERSLVLSNEDYADLVASSLVTQPPDADFAPDLAEALDKGLSRAGLMRALELAPETGLTRKILATLLASELESEGLAKGGRRGRQRPPKTRH